MCPAGGSMLKNPCVRAERRAWQTSRPGGLQAACCSHGAAAAVLVVEQLHLLVLLLLLVVLPEARVEHGFLP